jgi:hypothetical protein
VGGSTAKGLSPLERLSESRQQHPGLGPRQGSGCPRLGGTWARAVMIRPLSYYSNSPSLQAVGRSRDKGASESGRWGRRACTVACTCHRPCTRTEVRARAGRLSLPSAPRRAKLKLRTEPPPPRRQTTRNSDWKPPRAGHAVRHDVCGAMTHAASRCLRAIKAEGPFDNRCIEPHKPHGTHWMDGCNSHGTSSAPVTTPFVPPACRPPAQGTNLPREEKERESVCVYIYI